MRAKVKAREYGIEAQKAASKAGIILSQYQLEEIELAYETGFNTGEAFGQANANRKETSEERKP